MSLGSDLAVGFDVGFGELREVVQMAGFEDENRDLEITRAVDGALVEAEIGTKHHGGGVVTREQIAIIQRGLVKLGAQGFVAADGGGLLFPISKAVVSEEEEGAEGPERESRAK